MAIGNVKSVGRGSPGFSLRAQKFPSLCQKMRHQDIVQGCMGGAVPGAMGFPRNLNPGLVFQERVGKHF